MTGIKIKPSSGDCRHREGTAATYTPPCEVPSKCVHFDECRTHEKACSAYIRFMSTGTWKNTDARKPTVKAFRIVWGK